MAQLNQYGQMGNQALQQAFGGLQTAAQPFQAALQNAAYGGATAQAQAAGQGFQGVYDQTLANLRTQAQPYEQQQMNKLGEALFGTGRTGTTGGALQTEAMARGLSQADISRQLQATQEARNVQNQALTQAQGLAGIGQSTRGLQEDLLNSAFGRFGDTMGIASDLEAGRFGRQYDLSNLAVGRTGAGLQTQMGLAQFLPQLQQQYLQPFQTALGLQNNLQQQALLPYQYAANQAVNQGNLAMGAAGNVANMVTSPQYDFSPYGTTAANIFGGILNRRNAQG